MVEIITVSPGNSEHLRAVVGAEMLEDLLRILQHRSATVVEAAARALKIILTSSDAPRGVVFEVSRFVCCAFCEIL